MRNLYSHSRLSSFENCRKQFEFRYILKIPQETEGVEAFVGKRVHEVLERLYQFTDGGRIPGLEKVVKRYYALWDEHYDDKRVRIVREGTPLSFYKELGERCLRHYYRAHYPFDADETLGLEERVVFELDDAGEYQMQGIIDRIVRCADGAIEIHDYKTGARVPSQAIADKDRQLALYQIGLTKEYGDEQPFRLVWHYVAKGQKRVSERSPEQLSALREETIARIDQIESASEFPAKKNSLCNWCEYKAYCPAFGNSLPTQGLSAEGSPAAKESATTDGNGNGNQLNLV